MKTSTYLWLYLAELLLECEIFKTNVVDKIKTYSIFNNLFKNIVNFLDNVEKYGTARQATDANLIRRMRFACLINTARHTLRVCNTYCFSTAIMVSRTRLNVTFTRTFSPLFFSRVSLAQ